MDLFNDEILGFQRLEILADRIYGARDPLGFFYEEDPYKLVKEDGEYRLEMKLPFISKQDVELSKVSDELIIRVGSYKKNILIPKQVASSDSVRAKLEEDFLHITFQGDDHGGNKGQK